MASSFRWYYHLNAMSISNRTMNMVAASGLLTSGFLVAVVETFDRLAFRPSDTLSLHFQRPGVIVVEALSWIYLLLILIALPTLHRRQAEKIGGVGLALYLLLFATLSLTMGSVWAGFMVFPEMAMSAPSLLDSLGQGGGSALFQTVLVISLFGSVFALIGYAVISIRAQVGPRWAWAAVAVGFTLLGFVPVAGPVIAGVGIGWLGWDLGTTSSESLSNRS